MARWHKALKRQQPVWFLYSLYSSTQMNQIPPYSKGFAATFSSTCCCYSPSQPGSYHSSAPPSLAFQLISCLFTYRLQGGNKSTRGRGTVVWAKPLQTDGSRRYRMFTTLCVLLGLRVTQPWHSPVFLGILLLLFKLSTTLSGPWRVKPKTQPAAWVCPGRWCKALGLKYLPSEQWDCLIPSHPKRDNGIFTLGVKTLAQLFSSPSEASGHSAKARAWQ